MKLKLLGLVLLSLLITACGEKIYDVEYYRNNHDEAEKILEKCKDGSVSGDNCTNARIGLSKYKGDRFKERMNER